MILHRQTIWDLSATSGICQARTHARKWQGLARTIYIRCIYGIFGRGVKKYTVILYDSYTVYIYGSNQPYIKWPMASLGMLPWKDWGLGWCMQITPMDQSMERLRPLVMHANNTNGSIHSVHFNPLSLHPDTSVTFAWLRSEFHDPIRACILLS